MKPLRSFLLVLGLSSCGGGSAMSPSPPPPLQIGEPAAKEPTKTTTATTKPKPKPIDMCAVFPSVDKGGASPELPYGECFAGKKGAWMLVPSAPNTESTWTAIHVDAGGAMTKRTRRFHSTKDDTRADDPAVPEFGYIAEAWAQIFDFDGDGDPELFVGLRGVWSTHTGLALAESVLYTFKNGAIERYAPAQAFGIWKLEDRDGDGRPDIITSSPYSRSHGGSTPVFSPMLVAHSLPDGTFSTTDAVAARAARAVCPKPPPLPSLKKPRPTMREQDDAPLACARMWGMTTETIAKALKLDPAKKKTTDDWPDILNIEPPLTLHDES